ncbi:MAG: ABC transporter permease subunit [Lachnospiraceae bacterium]|nr:ABC transporter permease subunit [Lachnospiraceae bacterium]
MINLLRGEVYKLRKSKCLYICCIALVAVVMLFYGMLMLADKIQQGELANGTYGVVVEETSQETMPDFWSGQSILEIIQMMFGSFGSIIITVFVAIFAYGEYANGAIKNIVGKGHNRGKIFGVKYISTIISAILMMVLMTVATLFLGILFIGPEKVSYEVCKNLCYYAGIQLLLGAAFAGIVTVISQLCRNLGAGISISICMLTFSSLITAGLDAVLYYFKLEVKVSDYWIVDLISNCPSTDIDSSFAIRATVSAIIWIVAALGIGTLHFQKADVK